MAVVARQELRDLWIGGRGLVLAFAFSILLSAITYLGATNQALNFLERREAVNLTLQVAVGVGAMLALLAAADAISGERERGTLESLLLTPVAREGLVAGKLVAALSLWLGALLLTVPYVWFLGHDVGAAGEAVGTGALAGTLLAVGLTAFGTVVSALADSNRISLSVSLFTLLALFAPTQLPAGAQHGWAGEALLRVNPVTAAEHYVGAVVVDEHGWTRDLGWLASPLIVAVALTVVAVAVMPRFLRLRGGVGG
jgi:ABC-2 type transport system permease protein